MTDRIHAHSFGTATGASDVAHGYPAILAAMLGTTFDNTSHGGDMVGDQLKYAYARSYGAGDRTIIDLGLNDHGWNGINSAKLATFGDQLRNLAGWCALANKRKARNGNTPSGTLLPGETGVWSDMGLPDTFGRATTTPGSTKSMTCTGSVGYIAVRLVDNGYGATYEILKNGVVIGTYNSNAAVQTYATPSYPYGVRLHRIPGCVSGDVLTVRHVSGYLYYEWDADNNQTVKPKVYWVNIVKSLLYDRTAIPGFQVTSEANGQAYSDVGTGVIAELVADGLDATTVDLRSVFDPAVHLDPDRLHANNAGHYLEASTIANVMGASLPSYTYTDVPVKLRNDGEAFINIPGVGLKRIPLV